MNLRQFYLGKAIGFVIVLLTMGVVTGVYLIWRDGFHTGLFLLSVSSLILLVLTLRALVKKLSN